MPRTSKKKRIVPVRPDGTPRIRPLSKARKQNTKDWTIRNVDIDAIQKFMAYSALEGRTTGEALTRLLKIHNSRYEKQIKQNKKENVSTND